MISEKMSPKAFPENGNKNTSLQQRPRWHAVLNSNNTLISSNDVQAILAKGNIRIPIRDIAVYRKAFIHKSYLEVNSEKEDFQKDEDVSSTIDRRGVLPLQSECNERLEWLGDAQLQAAVTHYLWERYPTQNEGFLTKLRSKLVKTKNLAFLATKLGLADHLIISYHVEFGCHGRTNQRILENTFEALIGAIYIDFSTPKDPSSNTKNPAYGYEVARRFIIHIMEEYVDFEEMVTKDDNYKDQLMWFFQRTYNGAFPVYNKEKQENEYFHINVKDPQTGEVVGKGVARSKKKAEQLAAENALQFYAPKGSRVL